MPVPHLTAAHFSLAAIGLAWTLPFLQPFHGFPLTSFYGEWLAVSLGLLALVPLGGRNFWRGAALPAAALPVLGLIIVLAVQLALDRVAYFGQPLIAGLHLFWAVLLMVMAHGLRREIGLQGIATVLAWFLIAAGVLGALFALLQHYQISDLPDTLIVPKLAATASGNLAQTNHFANYSTLALVSLAYLYAGGRLHWAGVAAGAAPLLFVVGLSGSRSSLLFLAVMLALALLYAWRGGIGGKRLCGCIVLFIAGYFVAQWLATAPALGDSSATVTAMQRLAGGEGSSGAISTAIRLQLAREAWGMFMQAPLLGVGWGQFPWHDFEYRVLHESPLWTWPFNHAHNIVLHLLAETGLAGALLAAGVVLAWLWGLKRAAIDLQHWWLVALLSVIAVHSLLEHPLWFAYFLGIAAVALGLSSGASIALRLERVGPPLGVLLIAAGAFYLVSVLGNYRDFERLFARGAAQPGTSEFSAIAARAHREPLLRPYAEMAISNAMNFDRDRLDEKLAINSRVMRFAPLAGVSYRQAVLLALSGERELAERQLARSARVYPQELPAAIKFMSAHAAEHPDQLTPLIKSATVKLEQWHASQNKR